MDQVRIFALGGLDENGKNMYVVEVNEAIFIIEAGLKYPESDQLGVEFIIPDFSYLIQNKDRIKGIFITHAHDDVVAADQCSGVYWKSDGKHHSRYAEKGRH